MAYPTLNDSDGHKLTTGVFDAFSNMHLILFHLHLPLLESVIEAGHMSHHHHQHLGWRVDSRSERSDGIVSVTRNGGNLIDNNVL